MLVLKLGGSVITRKDDPETVDADALEAVTRALSAVEDLVVVHGGGSFGHHHANRHGISESEGSHDPEALLDVHYAMQRLNQRVIDGFRAHGVAAAPVHPFSLCHRDQRGELTFPTGGIESMVAEGFVPVLHGDGVVHRGHGVTVLSGDEIVVELARALAPDRVGLCSTVSGVLRDDEVIERIQSFEEVADVLGESAATDVTGGMAGKVRALLDLEMPATIFGPEEMAAFVEGRAVGTVIECGSG